MLLVCLSGLAEPSNRFYDPAIAGDASWLADLPDLLTPLQNAAPLVPEANRARIRLKGNYELAMPAEGEVVRLRLYDCQSLHLAFPGKPGTLISQMADQRLTAFRAEWPSEQIVRKLAPDADPIFRQNPYLTRIDAKVDFDWSGSGPTDDRADGFAIRWQGFLIAPQAGRYRIAATTDDGMRVYVAGKKVVESWVDQSAVRISGEIELQAGSHPIAMEYFESSGEATAKLEWQPPGAAEFAIIPSSALRSSQAPDAQPGLYGHYVDVGENLAIGGPSRLHRVHDDSGQWRKLGHGNLDIRYQNGEIVLARGEIVLLRAPQATPPPKIQVQINALLLAGHKVLDVPLPTPQDTVAAGTIPDEGPSFDSWAKDGSGGSAKSTLEPDAEGGIHFRRPEAGDYAHATTKIPSKTGAVITVHVREISSGAGVFIDGPFGSGRRQYLTAGHRRVLCQNPSDEGHVAHHVRDGHFMPESFWLRFEVGFNQVVVSTSTDQERWILVSRDPIESRKYEIEPEIVLGLILARSDSACEIRIGPPEVRRWHRLETLAERVGEPDALAHIRPGTRRTNAFRILTDASDQGAELSELATAFRELVRRSGVHNKDRTQGTDRWHPLESLLRRMVMRHWSLGDRRAFADLKQAWRDSLPLLCHIIKNSHDFPIQLNELHLLDLWSRGDWEALWYETERHRFQTLSPSADPDRELGRTNTGKMVEELRAIAASHLGLSQAARITHPLNIESNRDTQNLLAEFAGAIKENDLIQAGRLITGEAPGLAFASPPDDPELLLPVGTLLRRRALSHAPLHAHLQNKFNAIAALRLSSARLSWRKHDFEAVRDQFPGTNAATSAAVHLADRDFSLGRFDAARQTYEAALSERPADESLNRKTELSSKLAAESATQVPLRTAPKHRQFRMERLHVPSLSRKKLEQDKLAAGFTKQGDRIIVNHLSSLFAISADGKRVLWHHASEEVADPILPASPVCLHGIVIAPAYFKDEEQWGLVGRQLDSGALLWQRTLPGHIIGNPLVHEGNIIAWTYALDRGHAQLIMHHIAPRRGSVLQSQPQASFISRDRQLPEMRSAIYGSSIYSTLHNTLLRSDLDGKPIWIRRLPSLSKYAMGLSGQYFQPTAPIYAHGQLLVQAASSPGLYAIDPETGSPRWTHWQRELHRIAILGDQICALSKDSIETLSPQTGKVQHYWRNELPPDGILTTSGGKLLIADIIQKESPQRQRSLRWFNPVSGEETSCHIPQQKDQYGLRGIWSDGTRIFGFLMNQAQNKNDKFSFVVLHP
ncbi:MAG: hypothetical protein ACI8W8_002929 [Rhodothermales bacterium]|jgi:hypothetical protein